VRAADAWPELRHPPSGGRPTGGRVIVRRATEADLQALRELREELETELGGPEFLREKWREERADLERSVGEGVVLLAEEGGEPAGYAELRFDPGLAWLKAIYIKPGRRRQGLARTLLAEAAAACRGRGGASHLGLEVPAGNRYAQAFHERLGFSTYGLLMAVPLEELERRLARAQREPSLGRVFVQTDDAGAVERTVRAFLPRLGRSERTVVGSPRSGWVEVDDELCSRDPRLLRRLAQELSYRTGGVVLTLGIEEGQVVRYVLFDRGSVADEYASLPEYYGPLPPGDVVALAANPRVAQRLTGADPRRLRAVARTASQPDELPPPEQLYAELASALGVAEEAG